MKVAAVFFAVVAVALAADKYTTKYDSIDIDAILTNNRLQNVYVKCLLGTGSCNEEGQVLRDVVPDALLTDCSRCSDIQRKSVEKVIRHLIKNRKPDWDALLKKYDAEGKHREHYKKYIDELKV